MDCHNDITYVITLSSHVTCHQRTPDAGWFDPSCVQSRWSLWSLCMQKFGMPIQQARSIKIHHQPGFIVNIEHHSKQIHC